MASNDLIIDDDFIKAVSKYYEKQGKHLDVLTSKYVRILKQVRRNGITGGEVAEALSEYIEYAEKLNGQFGDAAEILQTHIGNFLTKIDEADQYLF